MGGWSTHVIVRATLARREDGLVNALLQVVRIFRVPPEEYQTRPRAAERLMRRRRDHIAVLERILQDLSGDEPRGVCNVRHQERAVLVSRCAEGGVVPVARVRGGAADDQTGLEETGLLGELVVVNELSGGIEAVGERLEVDRGGGDFLLGSL